MTNRPIFMIVKEDIAIMIVDAVNREDDCMMQRYFVECEPDGSAVVYDATKGKSISCHRTKEEAVAECRRLRAQDG